MLRFLIRYAPHRQNLDLRSQVRSVHDHGILFYIVEQNVLQSNCSIVMTRLLQKFVNENFDFACDVTTSSKL
jgi:hypothetical protein